MQPAWPNISLSAHFELVAYLSREVRFFPLRRDECDARQLSSRCARTGFVFQLFLKLCTFNAQRKRRGRVEQKERASEGTSERAQGMLLESKNRISEVGGGFMVSERTSERTKRRSCSRKVPHCWPSRRRREKERETKRTKATSCARLALAPFKIRLSELEVEVGRTLFACRRWSKSQREKKKKQRW